MDQGQTREIIEQQGVRVAFMQVDITEKGAPSRVIAECLAHFGVRGYSGQQCGHLQTEQGAGFWPR
jgi:hypothetical protein